MTRINTCLHLCMEDQFQQQPVICKNYLQAYLLNQTLNLRGDSALDPVRMDTLKSMFKCWRSLEQWKMSHSAALGVAYLQKFLVKDRALTCIAFGAIPTITQNLFASDALWAAPQTSVDTHRTLQTRQVVMSESHIAVQHDIVLKPVCFASTSDTFSASSIYFHDNDVL